MTKKHFIRLAEYVREAQVRGWIHEQGVGQIARFCEEMNPRFNRALWLDYIAGKCGPNGGRIKD